MKIAVAGATGLIGKLVVPKLESAGHEPVRLARSLGVDLTTGRGLDAALAGCDVIIDVSNVVTASGRKSVEFFGSATEHLLDAGKRAGVGHIVALSVVGIDRVPLGYYAGKLRQEALLTAGDVPWTVLRSTQFHEFAGYLLGMTRGPIAPMPRQQNQPVAGREVAVHLVTLAQGPARGLVHIAGPERIAVSDMGRKLLRAQGRHRWVVPVPMPGAAGRAMVSGGLLPAGPYQHGTETFDQYLARVWPPSTQS